MKNHLDNWNALTLFSCYRILIASFFIIILGLEHLPNPLGNYNPELFQHITFYYLFGSIILLWCAYIQFSSYTAQIFVQVLFDIILLTLFMYSSDGLNSGFGMLLLIAVAGGGLLTSRKVALFFAAFASLSVMFHEFYVVLEQWHEVNYFHVGALGMGFFLTAFFSSSLAYRMRISDKITQQQAINIKDMAELNVHIVQQLEVGVLVLDKDQHIKLCNIAAYHLLACDQKTMQTGMILKEQALSTHINAWQAQLSADTLRFKPTNQSFELQASFVTLMHDDKVDQQILVYLENINVLKQKIQQVNLASLGRLTASIAHEVRNPLTAIKSATQLLQESNQSNENQRLLAIIDKHSERLNSIINNILSISHPSHEPPQWFNLNQWLVDFVAELKSRYHLKDDDIIIQSNTDNIQAYIDKQQLYQILWNLSENAMRYSQTPPYLNFSLYYNTKATGFYLDIKDTGTGIKATMIDQLFEPFSTTEPMGTGLGLYITNELCTANQATLALIENTPQGCCFRILFSPTVVYENKP